MVTRSPPPMLAPRAPGQVWRALGMLAAWLGRLFVFAGALLLSLGIHLNLAPTRRVVRTVANQALAPLFQGTLLIGEVDRLSLHELSVRSVTAIDPAGIQAGQFEGIQVRVDLVGLVKRALVGELTVRFPQVHIAHANLSLVRSPEGSVGLAQTFVLAHPAPPNPNAAPTHVALPRIELDHLWAHGSVAANTTVDAELRHAVVSVTVDPSGTVVNVEPSSMEVRAPTPQVLVAEATFRLEVPPEPAAVQMAARLDGRLGDIALHAQAALDGQHLHATLSAPRITPAALGTLLPSPPLTVPVALQANAEGPLSKLAIEGSLAFEGGGSLDTKGSLTTAPFGVDVGFSVQGVDPRVALELPAATPLHAGGHVRLALADELTMVAKLQTDPLTIAGVPIPGVRAEATRAGGEWHGSTQVAEPGLPTQGKFHYAKDGTLHFAIESQAATLEGVPRLSAAVDGSARLKVSGTLQGSTLDARVAGSFASLRAPGGVEANQGSVNARVRGPLNALDVEAQVEAHEARAGTASWQHVKAHVSGPMVGSPGLRVEATLDGGRDDHIQAAGHFDARAGRLQDLRVLVRRQGNEVHGEVKSITAAAGIVTVSGLTLEGAGLGTLDGALSLKGQDLTGELHGRDVDLEKVARLAGFQEHLAGLANVDIALAADGRGRHKGHVHLELAGGEVAELQGVSGLVSATFEDQRVRLDGLLRLIAHAPTNETSANRCDGSIAELRIADAEGQIAGPLLDPVTWQRASGKLKVVADQWDLHCLARLAPMALPVDDVRGKLTARVTVERTLGERLPSVRELFLRTRGLELQGQQDEKPWESRGVDVEVTGSLDAANGRSEAQVVLRDDAPLAITRVQAMLDLPTLLDHPERRWASLRQTPLTARMVIPRRAVGEFATLPSFVQERLPPLTGDVRLDAFLDGSIEQPYMLVRTQAWDLAHSARRVPVPPAGKGKFKKFEQSPWAVPVDVAMVTTYDGKAVSVDAHVKRKSKEVANAQGTLAIELADVLKGQPTVLGGGFEVKFLRLPIGAVPFLYDRDIHGQLNGSIAVTGLGVTPAVKADLNLAGLQLGRDFSYEQSALAIELAQPPDAQAAMPTKATARFELSSKTGGSLALSASSEVLWKDGLLPRLASERAAELSLTTSGFRVAAFEPFVSGALSRLDGVLDGQVQASFARLDSKPTIAAAMKLTNGVFHVPQLGQELRNAEVTIDGGAGGVLRIANIHAEGAKGRLTGNGQAHFDGLHFVRANASFKIKRGEELPLTLEGVPFGDAYGEVTVAAEQRPRELAVAVGIPLLHVDLPSSTGRGVQSLEDNPDVVMWGDPTNTGEAKRTDGTRVALTFILGNIEVKGNVLDVGLSGVKQSPLKIDLWNKARISGEIQLVRGRIEVLHKPFDIEQGTVHMRPEEPANPYVNVTARWDSPDGPIYIDYAGVLFPIAPDKIKYRSPTVPEDKIMATLLFGGVEQATVGAQGAGVPGQALAAQLIAQQFSTQIAGNVSTSIAANDDGSLRPGLTYNSGDKVIELSTYGAAGQSASTGATGLKGQRTQVTIDWRFLRNWLLRGRIDVGSDHTTTGVDVLWQHRY